MEIKELQDFMKTDEGKVFADSITAPLVKKNKELLEEIKTVKAAGEGSLGGDELQKLRDAKTALEALEHQKLEDKGEYETLIAKMRKQMDEGSSSKDLRIADLEGNLNGLIIGNGLRSSLAKVGVVGDVMDVVVNFLSSEVQVMDGKAVVGALSLDEYVTQWAATEQAKYFIGSGATGGGGGGGGGSTESEWEVYFKPESANRTKQANLMKEDKPLYDKLKAKYATTRGRAPGMQPGGSF